MLYSASLESYERAELTERARIRQELDDALTEVEAGAGRVAQLQADVAQFRDELERTVIRAPFNGFELPNSPRMAIRPGISVSAISISVRP